MKNSTSTLQVKIQKMGNFLSGMVMPNIGVFIAWGIITALFIPTGWFPNEYLAKLVGPTITYLLPVLIGYTGGYNVYGRRGGVIGAAATMGLVIGSNITMLVGGMAMGPLAAWIMKKVDKVFEGKVKPGFEMLIDNFSIGIVGALLMIGGYAVVEPIFSVILTTLSSGVNWAVQNGYIPLAAIFVQPAAVLFLNNAINHGIMAPLGIQQVLEHGKSILFLVEGNCGPLMGVLIAYCFFGRGLAKKSAPAASLILFIGGIGEIYFPYILMKPKLIVAPIMGSMVSLFLFQTLGGGLVGIPSPGSFITFLLMTPKGGFTANLISFVAGFVVSLAIASVILKIDSAKEDALEEQESARKAFEARHVPVAGVNVATSVEKNNDARDVIIPGSVFRKVIVACDAGMGSSAMGASVLRNRLKKAQVEGVEVKNASISNIPAGTDLIITHYDLMSRAKSNVTDPNVQFMGITNFIEADQYKRIISLIQNNSAKESA
jgi:mannitol PTS system EIICBA or EIICB component